ncbi:paraquat-inducible protein A [Thalassotalea sp. LPB0316]|uniref:paraquat-inducible protein A n=1 Tax=Thalassotalea sp. LPB0316 TaxID=2769490 RepID=UPI00186648EE|nr:paraquat-inducible protein A [Thalassotalea sp. LPB0316]QOL26447.1 paraquat-inducible protein A [Thalassotalea sp. LPB0316]
MSHEKLACPRCDALYPAIKLADKQIALCPRCGCKMAEAKADSINRTLAISLAGLLMFIPGISMPMVGATLVGQYAEVSLIDCLFVLLRSEFFIVALGLFLFTIAIPLIRLLTAFYICLAIKRNRVTHTHLQFFRSYHFLDSWAMLHVFFLGISVAVYKLAEYADVSLNIGLAMFIGLLLCSILTHLTLDHHTVWQKLEQSPNV